LSRRKLLTCAGSATPPSASGYVRSKVPPVTSRLEQQLSLDAPQLVVPAPLATQLGGAWQAPEKQLDVVLPQDAPLGALLNAAVLREGWQVWQALPLFA
jgi:hypothetical protein